MRILYIGSLRGTSRLRLEALRGLGHDVDAIDPREALPKSRIVRSWSARTGGLGLAGVVRAYVLARSTGRYDLTIVDSGELIGRDLVLKLREQSRQVVNYNPDNPYVGRDGHRWRLFRRAVNAYSAVFVPRKSNVVQATSAGVKAVHRVWFTADDNLVTQAENVTLDVALRPIDVAFVGTWMPERGPFLLRLIEEGIPLRIFGPRWDRAPEYGKLKPNLSLGELNTDEYNNVLRRSKICIALLSKGNFDLHTTRSVEIPLCRSVLCAEMTTEHQAMYMDGVEAVFWQDAIECATKCRDLLSDPERINAIALAGFSRAVSNKLFNSNLMSDIVALSASCGDPAHGLVGNH